MKPGMVVQIYNPSYMMAEIGGLWSQTKVRPYLKNKAKKTPVTGVVAQVVEYEALSSNVSTVKNENMQNKAMGEAAQNK
jgi:hypothetical protein